MPSTPSANFLVPGLFPRPLPKNPSTPFFGFAVPSVPEDVRVRLPDSLDLVSEIGLLRLVARDPCVFARVGGPFNWPDSSLRAEGVCACASWERASAGISVVVRFDRSPDSGMVCTTRDDGRVSTGTGPMPASRDGELSSVTRRSSSRLLLCARVLLVDRVSLETLRRHC